MERYTASQVKRALAQEELLRRLEQGEDFESACQQAGLSLRPGTIPYLRRRYRQGGCSWEALIDHRHGHPRKLTAEHRVWLGERKREDPSLTQQELASRYAAKFQQSISQAHVSNVLRGEGVAFPGGQHYRLRLERALPVERAGVFFPPGRRSPDGPAPDRHPGRPAAEDSLSGG